LAIIVANTLACLGLWAAAGWIVHQDRRPLLAPQEFSNALKEATSGLLITSRDGRVLAANDKIARIFQCESEALLGNTLSSVLSEELWNSVRHEHKALARGESVALEFEVEQDDGSTLNLSCHANEARHPSGWTTYFVVEIADTTHRKLSRQFKTNAVAQLRRLIGKSSDLVVFTDSKLCITYANDAARNALMGSMGNLIGIPVYDLIAAAHRGNFMKTMERFTQQGRNEAAIDELQLANLPDTALSVNIARLREPEEQGYAINFGVSAHELQALADSKLSQSRFSQIFHRSPDAILLLRASDTMILDFNEGFTRLLGYTREQAIGELEADLGFIANDTERSALRERIVNDGETIDYETTLRAANGQMVHVEISLRYVEIDNELCVLCIGRDITKRISAEAALVESEEKFEKVFSQSPDGIVILRLSDGVVTDLNDAMLHRSEYDRDDIIGNSIYDFQDFVDTEDLEIATGDLMAENKLTNRAVTFITKSGERVPSLISATIVELSGEEHIMVLAKDISKLRKTEERLRSSEERFRGIFANAPFGIMLVDMKGRIFQANRTAAELLAYDEQHMFGIHISRLVPADDRPALKDAFTEMSAAQRKTDRAERRMMCQNGLEIWTNFHVVLQHNAAGEPQYYIVQIADITDIKRNQERMEQMAFYDTLTNLANRRLFHDRLEHAIEHAQRTNRPGALLYLDLDNFKRVNDTLGHQVGDHLLREVASRLQQCVRAEDTVGRTGGDEFTVLLAEINTPADAGTVAQKILNHLREPIDVSGHPLIITTSIGITVLPGDSSDPNVLMRNADLAMYKAKEGGRNTFQFYSDDMNTDAVKRLRTEYEIRQALDCNEFELFYQPKVSLTNKRVVGVESLIRWNHPERGVLGPDEFIAVAEETGTIIEIGTWVIEEACRACQTLSERVGRPIQVAINISPRQFRDPNLVTTMRRSLRETRLDPKNIEIEITETMLMQDVAAAQETVERLSELGVSLAIDDFGTGYSSLNYLKRFPINTVKLDRSFVTGLPDNADDMTITRAVIAMAHQLHMEVVAEGVETYEQLEFLAKQDCEYAQGWLFAKALPLPEAIELLSSDVGMVHVG
jgi:diguanylate cyclase (GGDEF)-like protein/PAS domain S-box-containing protein